MSSRRKVQRFAANSLFSSALLAAATLALAATILADANDQRLVAPTPRLWTRCADAAALDASRPSAVANVRAGDERAPVYVEDEEVVIPELRSTPYESFELAAAPKQRRSRRAQARSKPCKAERRSWDMEYTFSAARRATNRSNKTMRQLNKKLCRQLDDIIEELAPQPPVALD